MNPDDDPKVHYHWRFVVYNGPFKDGAQLTDGAYVDVMGYWTEEAAQAAVLSLVTREGAKLHSVWECRSCGNQNQMVESLKKLAT